MMKPCVAGLLFLTVAGCQMREEEVSSPQPMSGNQEVAVPGSAIDAADVMDALQMQVWKVPFNRSTNDRVDSVTLCIQAAGEPPRDILHSHLRNQAGEVLICLQETASHKLKLQLVWRGDSGNANTGTTEIDNPFGSEAGIVAATQQVSGRPGESTIQSTGTNDSKVRLYVRKEPVR